MKYTLKTSVKGRPMYYRDNKLCSVRSIPEIVLKNLKENEPYEYERQEVKVLPRTCIFCGEFGKFEKFINLQTLWLCEEHVYSKTIGQIAQQLREKELANATS